jgi:hypothetical protein
MAKSAGGGDPEPEGLPQHPYVERLKPDPSQPARRVVDLTGLAGNSDKPGYQRLYLTTRLDYYAEFPLSAIVHSEVVPADQSPFPGQEATRVSVSRDATIHYIWARSPQPVDEFDLDIRLGAAGAAPAAPIFPTAHTCIDGCPTGDTCHTQCGTCPATHCGTCPLTVCATCHTHCGTCPPNATCAGHGTCAQTACIHTCNTQCAQATCAQTQCNQLTCATCANVHTCAATCHV